jgi:hypothetical protein
MWQRLALPDTVFSGKYGYAGLIFEPNRYIKQAMH